MATPVFRKGESVILRATRDMGRVEAEPELDAGDFWYRVRFTNRVEQVVEDDLDPVDEADESIESLVQEGRWGTLAAFRCALAVERITTTNRSTVYSYKAQRILFEPYQYKPLLKVLDSPDRRILIADEVGLGKTIEAGLILTELEARQDMDKVLIACPSRLRDKWREELSRKFEQDFDIYDKRLLMQYIRRVRDNPLRGRLRAVVSIQTLRNAELREMIEAEIGGFDVVIVDEAHHARNPGTQTSEMLRLLGQLGDCVLLLTATPLHLGSRDLYTLLNALRPTEFRDPNVFESELQHHRGLIEAGLLVRTRDSSQLPRVERILRDTFENGASGTIDDPLAKQVLLSLRESPPDEPREWVELERRIQDLHPLATVLTRTRKRDVQEHAAERRSRVIKCQWTAEEDEFYQRLVRGSSSGGWLREKLGFGEIQRARQAASCLPATIESKFGEGPLRDATDDELTDLTSDDLQEIGVSVRPTTATGTMAAPVWRGTDSKYEKLRELLSQIRDESPAAKVLVFSFFKGTVRYLQRRLAEDGVPSLIIHGDIKSTPLQPETDERGRRIREFEQNPEVKVLISTEVGSEGLDFQFCHHLVNYDLPWNPMVVEQRIGRIDRFGQKSDVVHIHNLVVEGTVEDRILYRLYERIGIFRESIGDLEAILGDVVRELQRDYVSGKLTPEEADRRVRQAEYAINQRRAHTEELEKNASQLFGHEEYIRSEMERVGRLGRYISEHAILAVLKNFLKSHHPDTGLWEASDGVYGIRLTESLRQQIQDAARGGPFWFDRSKDGNLWITTDGDRAFSNPRIELVNVSHPLMKAAVSAIKPQLDQPSARVGQALVTVGGPDRECVLAPGLYFVVVFAHTVEGIRARRVLDPVVWSCDNDEVVAGEDGERLLHLATEFGEESAPQDSVQSVAAHVWARVMSEIRRRNKELTAAEQTENAALYSRRKRVRQTEFEYNREEKQKRLRTAERNKRSENILKAFRGQIAKLESDHRDRIAQLDATRDVSVRLSAPLAAALVELQLAEGNT